MSATEQVYRERLAAGPDCLADTLERILPADASNDGAMTRLARMACFDQHELDGRILPAFADEAPEMLDHGVRQADILGRVLEDDDIREAVSEFANPRTVSTALLVADFALTAVGRAEIEDVHTFGPQAARHYDRHSEWGYDITTQLVRHNPDLRTPETDFIRGFIARHHSGQARNPYGLEWYETDIPPDMQFSIDWLVMATKGIDYIDDYFTRKPSERAATQADHAHIPTQRFTDSYASVLCAQLGLSAQMIQHDVPFWLPGEIARRAEAIILDQAGDNGIGEAYRNMHPELVTASCTNGPGTV